MINLFVELPYFDLWSISHILYGMVLFLLLLNKGRIFSYLIIGITAIAWEVFEVLINVFEYPSNRVSDIVVTFIGFYLAFKLDLKRKKHKIVIFSGFIVWNLFGWLSYVFL